MATESVMLHTINYIYLMIIWKHLIKRNLTKICYIDPLVHNWIHNETFMTLLFIVDWLYCWCKLRMAHTVNCSWSRFILCRICRGLFRQWGRPPKGNCQVELQWPHGQDWSGRHRGNSRYDEEHKHFIMDRHTALVLDVKNVPVCVCVYVCLQGSCSRKWQWIMKQPVRKD